VETDKESVYKINLEKRNASTRRPSYTRTVYFNNTMSLDTMQALIDDCHRHIPEGHILTFQFESAGATTYTMSGELLWDGFYGGGELVVQGNTGEAGAETLHTSQDVFLDFSGQECDGIVLRGNLVKKITRRNLRVRIKSNGITNNSAFYSVNNYFVEDFYNYLGGNDDGLGYGLRAASGCHYALKNYVSNCVAGLYAELNAQIKSEYNDDTGTQPIYGLVANDATIFKAYQTSQPVGSVNHEYTPNGGKIWGTLYRDNTNGDEEGLLIQSGYTQILAVGTTITFNIAYSRTPHIVATAISTNEDFAFITARSSTQFTAKIANRTTGPVAGYICWIAIGKKVG
jgi:hypothetical protein